MCTLTPAPVPSHMHHNMPFSLTVLSSPSSLRLRCRLLKTAGVDTAKGVILGPQPPEPLHSFSEDLPPGGASGGGRGGGSIREQH
jgi:hypothetical protein